MNTDFYKVLEDLQHRLGQLGRQDLAKRLEEAVSAGSTGTEILMAVRWNLSQIMKEPDLPDNIRARIKELLVDLKRTLGN